MAYSGNSDSGCARAVNELQAWTREKGSLLETETWLLALAFDPWIGPDPTDPQNAEAICLQIVEDCRDRRELEAAHPSLKETNDRIGKLLSHGNAFVRCLEGMSDEQYRVAFGAGMSAAEFPPKIQLPDLTRFVPKRDREERAAQSHIISELNNFLGVLEHAQSFLNERKFGRSRRSASIANPAWRWLLVRQAWRLSVLNGLTPTTTTTGRFNEFVADLAEEIEPDAILNDTVANFAMAFKTCREQAEKVIWLMLFKGQTLDPSRVEEFTPQFDLAFRGCWPTRGQKNQTEFAEVWPQFQRALFELRHGYIPYMPTD